MEPESQISPQELAEYHSNFRRWFIDVMNGQILECEEAGFIMMMVTLPIMERYLRAKLGAMEISLTDKFFDELRKLFPAIKTIDGAKNFWNVYRNGLLHQVTLNGKRITREGKVMEADKEGALSCDVKEPVTFDNHSGFLVNPRLFAERVLDLVNRDFATFAREIKDGNRELRPMTKVHSPSPGVHVTQVGITVLTEITPLSALDKQTGEKNATDPA